MNKYLVALISIIPWAVMGLINFDNATPAFFIFTIIAALGSACITSILYKRRLKISIITFIAGCAFPLVYIFLTRDGAWNDSLARAISFTIGPVMYGIAGLVVGLVIDLLIKRYKK